MLSRAYSFVDVKSFDPEQRTFTGIATSPATDRVGDVIEPLGVKFSKRLPLLLYHDSKKPVGETTFGKPTKDGIPFEALISKIDRPGVVQDRINEAIDSLNASPPLIRAVSVGFRPLEPPTYIKETGGYRYSSIEVLELSMVVIPANQEATIANLKSYDTGVPAATGTASDVDRQSAGVSASLRVVKTTPQGRGMKKTYAEQIATIESTITTKQSDRDAIQTKVTDEGRTKDATERETFDTLGEEIKSLKQEVVDLKDLEEANKATAKPVDGSSQKAASASRASDRAITVKSTVPPEIEFTRMVLCKVASFMEFQKGNFVSATEIARKRYPDSPLIQQYLEMKTAVAGGTTTDSNFAAALLAPSQVLESAFLEYLRPQTIVGKFGTNGIPSLMRVPFNVTIQSQTSGASASWVGQGKGKPVVKFNSTTASLLFTKIAAISVITDELARFSSPSAEGVVLRELSRAVVERLDRDFVDPDKAVSSGVNPASITNGLTGLTTAGTSAANALTDLQALIAPFVTNNYDVADLVLIMPNSLALVLSLMLNSLGQRAFPDITINGGRLAGLPVITSQYVAMGSSYGNMVICASAGNIALADDGQVDIATSKEASIEMIDVSTQDATNGTGSSSVSMFQTNSIAIRAERVINWKKLRSTAVNFMDDVNWGSVGSPY